LRAEGVVAPWLDRAEGLANVREGREEIARQQLRDAVEGDPSLSGELGAFWAELALEDYEAGFRDRARARMAEAVLMDPTTDPGPLLPATADYVYRHLKEYEGAYPLYERLYRERPKPVGRHPEWVYRWGHLQEVVRDDLDSARAIYEEFIETWPDDRKQGRYVVWRYQDLLIEQAKQASAAGDVDQALELIQMTKLGGWFGDQQQKAEFVAGQICEDHEMWDEARVRYQRVLEYDQRVENTLPDQARARLEALDARSAN
jgi:tetratricopeptide (TPR) repeat protein